jgi:hypothetical protein
MVAANLLDELLGILSPDERLDGVAERVLEARSVVEHNVDAHSGPMLTRSPCGAGARGSSSQLRM